MSFEEVFFLGASSGGLLTAVFTTGMSEIQKVTRPQQRPLFLLGRCSMSEHLLPAHASFVLFFSLPGAHPKKNPHISGRTHAHTCTHVRTLSRPMIVYEWMDGEFPVHYLRRRSGRSWKKNKKYCCNFLELNNCDSDAFFFKKRNPRANSVKRIL